MFLPGELLWFAMISAWRGLWRCSSSSSVVPECRVLLSGSGCSSVSHPERATIESDAELLESFRWFWTVWSCQRCSPGKPITGSLPAASRTMPQQQFWMKRLEEVSLETHCCCAAHIEFIQLAASNQDRQTLGSDVLRDYTIKSSQPHSVTRSRCPLPLRGRTLL